MNSEGGWNMVRASWRHLRLRFLKIKLATATNLGGPEHGASVNANREYRLLVEERVFVADQKLGDRFWTFLDHNRRLAS